MPDTTLNGLQLDERIDLYVRGKMSEEEEMSFEADYLDNPSVLEKIEQVLLLKQGLAEVKKLDNVGKPDAKDVNSTTGFSLFKYFAVPQTAWGALVATFLLVPALLLGNYDGDIEVQPSVQVLETVLTRGSAEQGEFISRLNIDATKKQTVLSVVVKPGLGAPVLWEIEIFTLSGETIWVRKNLGADSKSMVYVNVNNNIFTQDEYKYIVRSSDGLFWKEGGMVSITKE